MKYSREEVMQYICEEDVKFIRLAFCDVFGRQKNISIMSEELSRAFEYGIAIDASFDRRASAMRLIPISCFTRKRKR